MGKRSLLLVDGDARSLRVLEVSLRKAGFLVATATTGREALEKARSAHPDLILSDTDMPEMNGFELCREIKADAELSRVPFVFLTGESAIESKIRGLELGVDEYLTKPIYIKEILTRIRILLQKKQRASLETRRDANTRFAGTLHDMGVVDLIQTIEVGRKSGLIHFSAGDGRQATIYFRNGAVIDAEAGHLQGADAVYRLLTWSEGEFELLFRTVRRKDAIETPTPALLMEGMRRLDEWGRLLEQLPPLTTRFEVDVEELAERLAELPDELNRILRLFDGRRSLLDVIDLAGVGDLECIELVSRLYFEGLLGEADNSGETLNDVSSEPSLDGWLGRQIPVAGTLSPLEPAPGEVPAAAEAEWDAAELDGAEALWPTTPPPAEVAIDADEPPTPPSGIAAPLARIGADFSPSRVERPGNGAALGKLNLVRRRSPDSDVDMEVVQAPSRIDVGAAASSLLDGTAEAAAPAQAALASGSDATRAETRPRLEVVSGTKGAVPRGPGQGEFGATANAAREAGPGPETDSPGAHAAGADAGSESEPSLARGIAAGTAAMALLEGRSLVALPSQATDESVSVATVEADTDPGSGPASRAAASVPDRGGASSAHEGLAASTRPDVSSASREFSSGAGGRFETSRDDFESRTDVGLETTRDDFETTRDDFETSRVGSDSSRDDFGSRTEVGFDTNRGDSERDGSDSSLVGHESGAGFDANRGGSERDGSDSRLVGHESGAGFDANRGDPARDGSDSNGFGSRAGYESDRDGSERVGSEAGRGGFESRAGYESDRDGSERVGSEAGRGGFESSAGSSASTTVDGLEPARVTDSTTEGGVRARAGGIVSSIGVGLDSSTDAAVELIVERDTDPGQDSGMDPVTPTDPIALVTPTNPMAVVAPTVRLAGVGGTNADVIIEPEFGPGDVADFDTSDLTPTPLPAPIPLGEERPAVRVKSSLGAEVAMVSGELAGRAEVHDIVPLASRRAERQNGSRVGVSGTIAPERSARPSALPSVANGRLRTVELDQELTAAAEIIEFAPVRLRAVPSPAAIEKASSPESALALSEAEERAIPRQSSPRARVSSIVRIPSGRAFARTFAITVAGAMVVGACFGLLFWWLGARDAVPTDFGPPESEDVPRAPIATGSGAASAAASEPPAGSDQVIITAMEAPTGSTPGAAQPSASAAATLYEEFYDGAKRARRHGDYDQVLDYVTRALQHQQTAQALTLQAEALFALGDPARALPPAETAVGLRPRYAQGWYIKGRIHRALGQKDEAREAFQTYLKIEPDGRRADQVHDFIGDM